MGKGYLVVELRVGDDFFPVANAKVLIKDHQGGIRELYTNESSSTSKIAIDAPDYQNTLHPDSGAPKYSKVDVEIPPIQGYMRKIIHGVQIFDMQTSILPVHMTPAVIGESDAFNTEEIYIPDKHGVDIDDEISNGEISANDLMTDISTYDIPSANEVSIPTYITVHLGNPNANVSNVRVPFKDYVKNVASSEIFPTWPDAAIRANIFAQISFALNRIHTVWYRSRGYEFDITNSTAFDQFFVYGREIFGNISDIVDGIFNSFIRRPGRREPFFASYCNGTTSTCEGLSQWGTVSLAQNGYSPLQILRYYYPSDVQIVQSTNFTERIGTFAGTALKEGSAGNDVRTMQLYLNRISGNYPLIPQISNPNGYYGSSTTAAVKVFQRINNLVDDGVIGKKTWYSISFMFAAVKRLAELDSEGDRIGIGVSPPTSVIQMGARGENVVELQFLLNFISEFFPAIPFTVQNGVFTEDTKRSVVEFQKRFGMTPDGIVGPATWKKLYDVYKSIKQTVPSLPSFPGTLLRIGSRGSDVQLMQQFLNAISAYYPAIPSIVADGIFGANTDAAVRAFQRQFGLTPDGIIGQATWNRILTVYSELGVTPTPPPPTTPPPFPGTVLRIGSRGANVTLMQQYLNSIARSYPSIPAVVADGIFGANTDAAVRAFQRQFGLTVDGVIGRITWDKIASVYFSLANPYIVEEPAIAASVAAAAPQTQAGQDYTALTLLLAMKMIGGLPYNGRMYR